MTAYGGLGPAVAPPLFPHVAAVLVLFARAVDPAPALRNVLAVAGQVVLVDNTPGGHPLAAAWRDEPGVALVVNENRGGLAGAYNAARRWLEQNSQSTSHVAFIDDDSDATVLSAFLADQRVADALAREDTAAVAPAHRDRATGLRARHLLLSRFRWHQLPREVRGLQRVSFVINSMSVWRIGALARIGPHNEWLGVDHVDTEYCIRAQRLGLKVYMHGSHEFAQSIGQRCDYRFLGRSLQSGGHSSARRYSIARSLCRLFKVWLLREPAFSALCVVRLAYELLGIVLAESGRPSKLSALSRGAIAGLLARG